MKSIRMFLLTILCTGLLSSYAIAKEPTNWFFGAGVGTGFAKVDKIYGDFGTNKLGLGWLNWRDNPSSSEQAWGVNWEVLGGYKHFLNDYVGFRYFVNLGMQHFEESLFSAGENTGFILDYTANVDVLVNFYTAERWSIGSFAGIGVGGVFVNSKAFKVYEDLYKEKAPGNAVEKPLYDGEGNTYKNHPTVVIDLGLRGSYFQKIRDVEKRVCNNMDGRRTCKVPISYFEHSFEVAVRFPLLTYKVTDGTDILAARADGTTIPGSQGQLISVIKRPGYELKNPYKITFRYVFAF